MLETSTRSARPGSSSGSTYAHRILDAMQRFATFPALRFKEQEKWRNLSYQELGEHVLDLAAALKKSGIGKADRFAIWLETDWRWILVDFAVQLLGAVTVPVYHSLPAMQAASILRDAGAKAIFSSSSRLASIQGEALPELRLQLSWDRGPIGKSLDTLLLEGRTVRRQDPALADSLLQPPVNPEDLSAIIYTSGTTGEPKGVMLSHRNILANAEGAMRCFMANQSVIFLHLPLAHVVARNTTVALTLLSGSLLAIAEPPREKLLPNLLELKPTAFITVPYLLDKFMGRVMEEVAAKPRIIRSFMKRAIAIGRSRALASINGGGPVRELAKPLQFSFVDRLILRKIRNLLGGRIKLIVIGGANSNRESLEFFWGIGIPVYEGYGSTEVTNSATFTWPQDMKLGTVGRAAPGMEFKLAADGEVLIRGPNVMQGYWNRPEATREVLDAEGWYHSGDIGKLDPQGYLSIVDRKKEIFVLSTGKNVAPQAVENAIKRSSCVNNVCSIGDKQRFMAALIVPEMSIVKKRLKLNGDLSFQDPRVLDLIAAELRKHQEDLADFEKVKRFRLLEEPFSVENHQLTPILKLRRKPIAEKYRKEIEALYSDASSETISL